MDKYDEGMGYMGEPSEGLERRRPSRRRRGKGTILQNEMSV